MWQHLYGSSDVKVTPYKFQVGDLVRISKAKRTFKKGYLPNWTRETFTVVQRHATIPLVYVLQDERGETLDGTFYEAELQKVIAAAQKVYKIEQVLNERKKGKNMQYLVKWEGYPPSFNSWLSARDLRKYKG